MQPDLPIVIAEWPRNNRETVRVRLDSYGGRPTIDCRCWYVSTDGEIKPDQSGITLSTNHLPELTEALGKAMSEAQRLGLIPKG